MHIPCIIQYIFIYSIDLSPEDAGVLEKKLRINPRTGHLRRFQGEELATLPIGELEVLHQHIDDTLASADGQFIQAGAPILLGVVFQPDFSNILTY